MSYLPLYNSLPSPSFSELREEKRAKKNKQTGNCEDDEAEVKEVLQKLHFQVWKLRRQLQQQDQSCR